MSIVASPRPALLRRVRTHMAELVRLAAPVIVSRAGLIVMMAVDTAIVGHVGAEELAFFGLAQLPGNTMLGAGVGLLLGTAAMTAHAVGAGRVEECGRVLRRSLPYALALGVLMAMASLFGAPLFRLAGQAPEVAEGGGRVLAVLGLGQPGLLLYVTAGFFLEGMRRPVPVMLAMVAGNLVNAALAWALATGAFGLPAWGAMGTAAATSAVRWAMALGLIAYIWTMPDHARFGVRRNRPTPWAEWRRQRTLGYASGLSIGLESAAFAVLGLLAGAISAEALATFTVGLSLTALPFMASVGLGSATAVRVGIAYGRRDTADMALAGWTGLGVAWCVTAAVAVLYRSAPDLVAGLYTDDPDLLARAAPLIRFAAFILMADGGQAVMASALRGRNDAWVPTALHFVSYALVMVPAATVLSLGLGRGERGLFEGILVASVVSVTILSTRFAWLGRTPGGPRGER